MRTDRELVELAADAAIAAGYDLAGYAWSDSHRCLCKKVSDRFDPDPEYSDAFYTWMPLQGGRNALQLVRLLRMTIAFEPSRDGWSPGAVVNGEFAWLAHDDELNRAIVRAAAEIGAMRS